MKTRLDIALVERGLIQSREKAKAVIMSGNVYVNGQKEDKAGTTFDESKIKLEVRGNALKYVSRGGLKLEKAMDVWGFDLTGKVCMDIGASTGGFTDCMLQNGAKKVYAIDVGESQLDKALLSKNVVIMDNTNARYLSKELFPDEIDGVVCDVSFISLTYVLPSIKNLLKNEGFALVLIKPQFECGKEFLTKTGIVKDVKAKINACRKIYNFSKELGLTPLSFTFAPIREKKNVEYIMLIKNNIEDSLPFIEVEKVIRGNL